MSTENFDPSHSKIILDDESDTIFQEEEKDFIDNQEFKKSSNI